MENTGIKNQIVEEICELARRYDVEQVILFGSRARGDFSEKSDIDLAVLGGDVLCFSLDLDEEVSTLLKFDVVDLGKPIQKELRAAIEKEGRVLYEKI
ncbi:MAG: nucleotidyltransferase domain-containing protein [Eubacterium sp.]|nr:nucleotidyltransferase domain-containing protein [Eubacterium sp.]